MQITIEQHGIQFIASDGERFVEGESMSDAVLRLELFHEVGAEKAEEFSHQSARFDREERAAACIMRLLRVVHSEKAAPMEMLDGEIQLLRRHLSTLNDMKG